MSATTAISAEQLSDMLSTYAPTFDPPLEDELTGLRHTPGAAWFLQAIDYVDFFEHIEEMLKPLPIAGQTYYVRLMMHGSLGALYLFDEDQTMLCGRASLILHSAPDGTWSLLVHDGVIMLPQEMV